jgi:hypothetical protein
MLKLTHLLVLFLFSSFVGGITPLKTFENFSNVSLSENTLNELVVTNPLNIGKEIPKNEILNHGIKGYLRLLNEGKIEIEKPFTIIDYSLPSNQKRLWIIDMENGNILHHDLVSHGRNSGDLMALSFSNVDSSYMSSLGFYLTGETYFGKHGYSLRLDGLEKGFNNNARTRAIVIHGADYVDEEFVNNYGRLGRSLGCPALPNDSASAVIDMIKDNSCVFIYGKNTEYLIQSSFLNS